MALTKVQKGNIIIHSFSAGAAAWSAATAMIPVAGPLLADTAGLTAVTVAMTYSVARLFKKSLETSAVWAFGAVVLGTVFGTSLLKAAASLVPGFGSAVNATITFGLHEATGWGLYLIFDEGGDLPITRAAFTKMKARGQTEAAKRKEEYDEMIGKLSTEDRRMVEELQKKIGKRGTSEEDKQGYSEQVEAIFAKYT